MRQRLKTEISVKTFCTAISPLLLDDWLDMNPQKYLSRSAFEMKYSTKNSKSEELGMRK